MARSPLDPHGGLCVRDAAGENLQGAAFGVASNGRTQETMCHYYKMGHTGFMWAGRRAVLEKFGLYDRSPHTNNDKLMSDAFFPCESIDKDQPGLHGWVLSAAMDADYEAWAHRLKETLLAEDSSNSVGGGIGYVDGIAFHLWHGEMANRDFPGGAGTPKTSLHVLLANAGFDPSRDLVRDGEAGGAWRWADAEDSPVAAALVGPFREYFVARREEEGPPLAPWFTPLDTCSLVVDTPWQCDEWGPGGVFEPWAARNCQNIRRAWQRIRNDYLRGASDALALGWRPELVRERYERETKEKTEKKKTRKDANGSDPHPPVTQGALSGRGDEKGTPGTTAAGGTGEPRQRPPRCPPPARPSRRWR